jgi:hypothetical protein
MRQIISEAEGEWGYLHMVRHLDDGEKERRKALVPGPADASARDGQTLALQTLGLKVDDDKK